MTDTDEANARAAAWIKRCGALSEINQRVVYIKNELLALPPGSAVDTLAEVLRQRLRGATAARKTLQAATRALGSLTEDYEWTAAAYVHADRQEYEAVKALLAPVRPQREPDPAQARQDPVLSQMTLGMRRQVARGQDRYLLDRLALDEDAGVVLRVLNNPRTTEPDVVRIAARRPASGAVLAAVFGHPRWAPRGRVRVALVRNPYTPSELSLRLLPELLLKDLKGVAEDSTLHPAVRDEALRLIGEREG